MIDQGLGPDAPALDPAGSTLERAAKRFADHLRTPVYREGYALVLSVALGSVLGFAYWVIAAHEYSPAVVGLNSAAISAMMLVAGISQLNLVGAILRFLPTAGRSSWRLVAWSYASSVVVALLLTPVFLVVVNAWVPKLAFLSSDDGFAFWFVAVTIGWCIFNLQDAVATAVRRAIWVPVDNVIFGIAKIVLLASFAAVFPRFGIFASWSLGVIVSVVVISAVLAFRLIPAHVSASVDRAEPVAPRAIRGFVAADYVGSLSWVAAVTLIPLAITQRLGSAENAYYSLAWVMTMPLFLVSANTAGSLVVSVVKEQERLREYTYRVFVQTARLVVPAALALALAAPLVLRLFGADYVSNGTFTLRLLALSSIPTLVGTIYTGVWRAQQRLSLLVWVRCVQNAAVILLSLVLLGPWGIRGPAVAWLVVQTVSALASIIVWPRVLTGDGTRPPLHLRRVFAVRNAAAKSGVLAVSQAVRRRAERRRRLATTARTVLRILADLPESGTGSAPRTWIAQKLPRSVTEKTVLLVGPPRGSAQAVIKLAASDGAARSLAHEAAVVSQLDGDPRLDGWRSLVPNLLASGEIDGGPYLVEQVLPGVEASRLLARGGGAFLEELAEPVKRLHRLTASTIEVGDATMESWVDAPLAILEAQASRNGALELWERRALDRLGAELHDALLGRTVTVSWIHGDYVPGNVLVDESTRAVTGIIDWELATASGLAAVDLVQLVLSARMQLRGRELGEVVTDALAGDWTEHELRVLDGAALGVGDESLRALVLLTWVRHASNMLTTAELHGKSWLWTKANLQSVLARLA